MDEEIYLDPYAPPEPPPRRPGSVRVRIGAVAGLVVVLAVAALVQRHRHDDPPPMAAAAPPPAAVQPVQLWPQGQSRCGQLTELPIITSDEHTDPVNDAAPVGGTSPGLVDLDSGALSPTPGLVLATNQYVSQQVRSTSAYFSLVRSCPRRAVGTVIRSRPDAPQRIAAPGRTFYGLLSDDAGGVWGELYSGAPAVRPEGALGTTLVRLDQPAPEVVVPPELEPLAIHGNTLVATSTPRPVQSSVVLFDLRTHQQQSIGSSYGASVSRGWIVWNSRPCSSSEACPVRTYDLSTGKDGGRDYHLPLESSLAGGVLSPDRTKFAYVLPRETQDPAYRSQHGGTPADLVVLDLRTGVIDPVPNIELAPGARPDLLRFSPDGYWLEIGFATNTGTDLYAWHTGLSKPVRSPSP